MGAGAKEEGRRKPTRYTPEMKRDLKAKAEARRAKTPPPPMSTTPGLAGDMVRGVQSVKNRKKYLDKAIEDAGG
jgi:hypothetical protein